MCCLDESHADHIKADFKLPGTLFLTSPRVSHSSNGLQRVSVFLRVTIKEVFSGLRQLLTTSCFLKSESSHSLAIVSWKCVLCVSPSGCVRCGLTLKQGAGAFARVQSQFVTAPPRHTPLSVFHTRMQPIMTTAASCMALLRAIKGMVRQNKLSMPLYFLCSLLLRYQETDASSTILASCCNLPVQLNDGAWELHLHSLLIASSPVVLCLAAALQRGPHTGSQLWHSLACTETQYWDDVFTGQSLGKKKKGVSQKDLISILFLNLDTP